MVGILGSIEWRRFHCGFKGSKENDMRYINEKGY